uniref:Si:dkey-91i10.3 n=1 Tax=Neogobius melanostomus TaxID=47308 RepID=A0A8C6WTN5_9GOBI
MLRRFMIAPWHFTGQLQAGRLAPALSQVRGVDLPHRSASTTSTVMDNAKSLKTIDDLNGPTFMNTLYWLFVKGYFKHAQQLQIIHNKIWGPLWKSKFGPLLLVNVASAELIEQVLRQEGRYPVRTDMPHWRSYREMRNQAHGPLTEMGAKWQRIRSILNPRMLKPKHVSSYTDTINEVVTDFILKVSLLRDSGGQGAVVHNLTEELYKFAFEGICSVLFETRMGCMDETIPEETQQFITSVGDMFMLSQIVIIFPRSVWPYLPFYRKFVAAWDYLFKVSDKLIQKKVEEIQQKVDLDKNIEGAYLTHLLLSEKMTLSEVLGSITELLLAGVDTTSNTISWALYHLAKEPEIQEQLYQEVSAVCPGETVPTSEDTAQMPFMKAVIRETLRLYPVVPGNARYMVDNEIIVGDHLFPKKLVFPKQKSEPKYAMLSDLPEPALLPAHRWLRGSEEKSRLHPFGSVPFGFGTRACLGRRVAELEMYLLLSRLIQRYELRPDPAGSVVKPITRTLLCPEKPINLQFLDRIPTREAQRSSAS